MSAFDYQDITNPYYLRPNAVPWAPVGKMLAIPNSAVVNIAVACYTNFPHLRLEIDLTVGVGEDLNRIREVFLGLVGDDPRFMRDAPPEMVVTAINDHNVAIQFRVWLADERQHIPERFELRERIFEAMRQAGIEMPFETFQLAPFEVRAALTLLVVSGCFRETRSGDSSAPTCGFPRGLAPHPEAYVAVTVVSLVVLPPHTAADHGTLDATARTNPARQVRK